MSKWEKSDADFIKDAAICTLNDPRNDVSSDPAGKPDSKDEFYCRTCKGTSSDWKKLCSPALR